LVAARETLFDTRVLGSRPALIRIFLDVTGIRVVGVRCGDEAELVGVDADASLLAESFEQRVAEIVGARDTSLIQECAVALSLDAVLDFWLSPFFVVAELVRFAHDLMHAVATFGVALDLCDLAEGFDLRAQHRSGSLDLLR
jgi:hypothetical protein